MTTRPAMVSNFLRPPRTASAWGADAVRVAGLLSVIVAAVWFEPTDAGILALALPALVVPRFIGVRPSFDIVSGITVLVAAWSNVVDLYRTLEWWDIPMHLVCTAVLAALAYLAAAEFDVVPRPGTAGFRARTGIVVTTALGLALSAVWEMIEWLGKAFVDSIYVTYDDTIGDMAVGGIGSLVAGIVVARVRLLARDAAPAASAGRAPDVTPAR
ncbi:MAG: hypothetical protein PGN24_11635 [Microbacterium arborescens]